MGITPSWQVRKEGFPHNLRTGHCVKGWQPRSQQRLHLCSKAPVLQALVHEGILKGVRGPRGGYELGRDQGAITADEILRAAGRAEEGLEAQPQGSPLVVTVVMPALAQAEHAFSTTLGAINLDDLMKRAEKAKLS